jgi:hypothetical protein
MTPSHVRNAIASFPWKFLAINRVNDLSWLRGDEFMNLPLTSPLLPKRPDGSDGGAFDVWHAALRVYETVSQDVKRPAKLVSGRGNYLVSIQLDSVGDVDAVKRVYAGRDECRSFMVCKIAEGLAEFPEVGPLPEGLVVMEFDGERAPEAAELIGRTGEEVVRLDIWEMFVEAGDRSLEL